MGLAATDRTRLRLRRLVLGQECGSISKACPSAKETASMIEGSIAKVAESRGRPNSSSQSLRRRSST
jgi:hypothetical protein